MPDFLSAEKIARDMGVSEKTVTRWFEEENDIFTGATIRRNNTIFVGSHSMLQFEERYDGYEILD